MKTKTIKDNHLSPKKDAIEKLEDFIKVNHLKANKKIPSEKDLCDMWDISRSTLRQAIDVLIDYGYLYRIKDKGVFVSPKRYERNMAGVDAMVKDLINQGNRVSKKIISMNEIISTKRISKKMSVRLGTKIFEIIRYRVINDVPCTIETAYINAEKYPDFLKHYNEKASMDKLFGEYYDAIQTSGVEHINVTYASEDEAKVLKIDNKAPLFFADGISVDQ
ncbi:MAG: GntR family transcriptional regulator, partial [Erysipelotrichaceae bacterium]|nr:GntR family transcriptional regulator [Erysipelotrichaceae bacterium]